MASKHNRDPKERLLESRNIDPQTGCWNWTKARNGSGAGYGQIWYKGKFVRVSRLSYQLFVGPIPEDKPFILHRCDNPPCFNPDHLWAGTAQDNHDDMVAKGRNKARATTTHCKNGHPRTERGSCMECAKQYMPAYYQLNKERLLKKARLRDRRKVKDGPNPRHSSMVQE